MRRHHTGWRGGPGEYEELEKGEDGRHFRTKIARVTSGPAQSDIEAYMQDMITVAPLQFDWTRTRYSII